MADSHNLLQKDRKYPKTQLQLIPVFHSTIERLHMMSQHSNSLATAMAAILVHRENLLRLCTKMLQFPLAKECMQMLYSIPLIPDSLPVQ